MPALRPLSRLKPTMTLEEGIGLAMQEWQRKSTCDRRVYFEMAEKFMEFEAEEQMQVQKLQLKKGAQTQPPPAPPRPDPRGPPAPVVGRQPAPTPRKAVPSAQCAHTPQPPWETESRDGIPPEAEQEDMDITDELPMGAPGGGWEDEVKDWLQDEGLLSYLDQLCSQEDFVTQAPLTPSSLPAKGLTAASFCPRWRRSLTPSFLKQMNSPDAQQDPLALAEELEQEEGLTAAQLAEERLLASEEGGVQAPPSHGAPRWDSSPSESASSPDARRREPSPQLGVSDTACLPETGFQDRQRRGPAHAPRSRPPAAAVSSGREQHPPLRARCPPAAPQGHGPADCARGPRGACVPGEASLAREPLGPADRPRGDEEDLASLAFLWASPGRLLPCALSLSPVPASGLARPGGRGPRGAARSRSLQRLGLSRLPLQLASLGSALWGEAPPVRRRPHAQGPSSGSGGGQHWLRGWFPPHSLTRESVTRLTQGAGGSGTAASMERRGSDWLCCRDHTILTQRVAVIRSLYILGFHNHKTQGPGAKPGTLYLKQSKYMDSNELCTFSWKDWDIKFATIIATPLKGSCEAPSLSFPLGSFLDIAELGLRSRLSLSAHSAVLLFQEILLISLCLSVCGVFLERGLWWVVGQVLLLGLVL
ncbi:hypothetical protein QTO34_005632 [Cnephaeus nilssonii]|uniref:Nuclear Testis protein N-terminal domain-containing protein n=1 Tax=Cnephaeus nilssonii TaxID=3371016 RepID=A0AA40HPJ4_CNENI|nr:hypothetical protein QTO34_005632 [Eptesicus nilssonii]